MSSFARSAAGGCVPAGTTSVLAAAIDRYLADLENTDSRVYHSSKPPVDARACTDADHGDGELLRDALGQLRRDFFQHDGETSRVL